MIIIIFMNLILKIKFKKKILKVLEKINLIIIIVIQINLKSLHRMEEVIIKNQMIIMKTVIIIRDTRHLSLPYHHF